MLVSLVVLAAALAGTAVIVLPEPARSIALWALIPLSLVSVALQWRERRNRQTPRRILQATGLAGPIPFIIAMIFIEHMAGRVLLGWFALVFLLAGLAALLWPDNGNKSAQKV